MGEKEKIIEMKRVGKIRGLEPYRETEDSWFFMVPLPDGNFMEVEAPKEEKEKITDKIYILEWDDGSQSEYNYEDMQHLYGDDFEQDKELQYKVKEVIDNQSA